MNHFHFPSQNAKETISFYERYFEFSEVKTLGHTHVLKSKDDFVLAVDEATESQPLPKKAHLGFQFREAAVVEALFKRMGSEGVTIHGDLTDRLPRFMHYYCSDPTGNTIEVGWYQL